MTLLFGSKAKLEWQGRKLGPSLIGLWFGGVQKQLLLERYDAVNADIEELCEQIATLVHFSNCTRDVNIQKLHLTFECQWSACKDS
jgi:hypothetical protein